MGRRDAVLQRDAFLPLLAELGPRGVSKSA
jgi:hypothetical protein